MKKYFYEAAKTQLEKPTERAYMFCATAKTIVYAENEAEAQVKAEEQLRQAYHGSGTVLGPAKLTKCTELPVDWNYGYGEGRGTGTAADQAALQTANVIR